jgi:hypothetical protein
MSIGHSAEGRAQAPSRGAPRVVSRPLLASWITGATLTLFLCGRAHQARSTPFIAIAAAVATEVTLGACSARVFTWSATLHRCRSYRHAMGQLSVSPSVWFKPQLRRSP